MKRVSLPSETESFIDRYLLSIKEKLSTRLLKWFDSNQAPHPWRLQFRQSKDPYVVLISEIMLQQTTLQVVIPAFSRFISKFPNIQSLANANEDEVRQASKGLGYYRRFANLVKTAKIITQDEHWPESYDCWKTLPGIGDYTASALASIGFNKPEFVVDGNVERVFWRLLALPQTIQLSHAKKKFKQIGNQVISKNRPGDYNQAIMELGQKICLKSKPLCKECPVQKQCQAYTQGIQEDLLPPKPKVKYQEVNVAITIHEIEGKIGIVRRTTEAKFLKNSLGFPYEVVTNPEKKVNRQTAKPLATFNHSITKYRITSHIFLEMVKPTCPSIQWLNKSEVSETLTTSLDLKAWSAFSKAQAKKLLS